MNLQFSLASALAQALLHSIWQLALIGGLASLGFNALSGAPAKARHTLGMACLLAMLLAPVATFVLCWQPPAPGAATHVDWQGASGAEPGAAVTAAPVPPWRDWLLVALSQAWLIGVAAMTLRQFGGWRLLRRIEAQPFVQLPGPWRARVDALTAALGIGRRVSVRLAQHVVSPFTTHALRPVIWLPLALLTRLPADQIEALLAHELAHIRRLDWCWNALQCAAEGLLFHHPAMWWLSRRIREEREHACDDLAVSACGDAVALAEALAGLQRSAPRHESPVLVLAAEGGGLLKRVEHLLAGRRRPANWRATALLAFAACCAALVALQVAPPAHLLTNLTVDASSSGELTPGHHREYTASYLGEKQRHYEIRMDAQGRVEESYSEGGEHRPIDAGVRTWLGSMVAMNESGGSGKPAALPPPPAPDAPPRLQSAAMSDESIRLMGAIGADPRLLAVTGQPARFDRTSFHGRIHTWGSRDFHLWGIDDPVGGEATFTIAFEGPRGRAQVRYAGRTVKGGGWAAESFEVLPLQD
ncbi:MAG: M56 family metallopeptidase [Burkholderiales bacterium]|jgi:beta-lactamase regulating signal transducer with metallopeptidase domain|nr:M56 family metallopeptidase [Burkholderiales bacterium]